MIESVVLPARPRPQRPDWIRVRAPAGETYGQLRGLVHGLALHTVCEEALCPQYRRVLGSGHRDGYDSGRHVHARVSLLCYQDRKSAGRRGRRRASASRQSAIARLQLNYVVIASVDRDDLSDGGAAIFAETVRQIKTKSPKTLVEILTPDFRGVIEDVRTVVQSNPDVFGHNIETVRRLTTVVRDRRAGYEQTMNVLRMVKEIDPIRRTKSSILVGMGETPAEIFKTMRDLRDAQVDLLAIGQYCNRRTSSDTSPWLSTFIPINSHSTKQTEWGLGFKYVAAGPLVRSSYKAWEAAFI